MATAHRWVPYLVDGRPSEAVKRATDLASGAYAIRRKDSHGVVYVGESNLGHMWRTLARHFQAPATFTATKKPGGANAFATDSPGDYEVTWKVTSRGKRAKKDGDQRAMALQARWIKAFRKAGNRLHNRDDGMANAEVEREYRAHVAKQAAEESERPWYENPPMRGTTGEIMREWKVPGGPLLRDGDRVRAGARAGRFLGATWASRAVGGKRAARAIVFWDGAKKDALADPSTLELERKNPATSAPRGALTELGRLTRLSFVGRNGPVALGWGLRTAPVLAYDASKRLHVVYTGKVLRPSRSSEIKEYERTHWGAAARGKVRRGSVAVPPWAVLGSGLSVTYTTQKGADSSPVDYVHAWGEGGGKTFVPPDVVEHVCRGGCASTCAARHMLALAGGSYVVSERGIVG